MEWTYQITADDFVAFNHHFVRTNRFARSNVIRARIQGSVMILAAGGLFGSLSNNLTPIYCALIVVCAVLYFLFIPKYLMRNIATKVRRMIEKSSGGICGEKTFSLLDGQIRLVGEKEDNAYDYDTVLQIVTDTDRYYIYVGEMESLIVPFTAFADPAQREQFYRLLCEKVIAGGGKIA